RWTITWPRARSLTWSRGRWGWPASADRGAGRDPVGHGLELPGHLRMGQERPEVISARSLDEHDAGGGAEEQDPRERDIGPPCLAHALGDPTSGGSPIPEAVEQAGEIRVVADQLIDAHHGDPIGVPLGR